jgi:hypothetical protein
VWILQRIAFVHEAIVNTAAGSNIGCRHFAHQHFELNVGRPYIEGITLRNVNLLMRRWC